MFTIRLRLLSLRCSNSEVPRRDILGVLSLEELGPDFPDPLLICLACCRMPSVQTVELYADSISGTTLDETVILLADFLERIE